MEGQKMASLKTICQLYDWKYDTILKKYKRGLFVQGYKDPAGRQIRFMLGDVQAWATREPVRIPCQSLAVNRI